MKKHGFIKVAASTPSMKVADIEYNTKELIKEIKNATKKDVKIVVTPELSLTGYTCADLFKQDLLINKSLEYLNKIIEETKELDIISIIGAPIIHENNLYNTAVVINKGSILGIVPKINIPNNNEFYEKRWFKSGTNINNNQINILNQETIIDTNILFQDQENKNITFAIEVCEDLWHPNSPSIKHSLNGATMIFNPSASNELIGKSYFRKQLVSIQSAKLLGAYIYTSSGINESTTDLVFSGHTIIAENGQVLAEEKNNTFSSSIIITDIDTNRLVHDRQNNSNFNPTKEEYKIIKFNTEPIKNLDRKYDQYPFVPKNKKEVKERCNEIFNIQSSALAKRLKHINTEKTVIGISGGLDSTLAFLVIIEAYKKLNINPKNIIAITMPGFGTTDRTYENACNLVKEYKATLKEISIKDACIQHFNDIEIEETDRSITYENSQARERTQILMDIANKENALVIGTGDLSELILGWCTYNGDHMSSYAVNTGIPKTLVRYLVEYVKYSSNSKTLQDILDTPISPELLPPDEAGNITQKTESKIGPYVLHDFYTYHFLRYGASSSKIYLLAKNTFKDYYQEEEIKKWLKTFIKKFFQQQFKRSCLPDGPKVGSIAVSPRGDLRLPSDASCELWISDIEE